MKGEGKDGIEKKKLVRSHFIQRKEKNQRKACSAVSNLEGDEEDKKTNKLLPGGVRTREGESRRGRDPASTENL